MKKLILTITVFCLFFVAFITPTAITYAASAAADACSSSFFGLPTWHKYLEKDGNCEVVIKEKIAVPCGADNKETCINERFDYGVVWGIAFAILEVLLTLAGVVALVFVMSSAFKFVTAQGLPDKIAKARDALYNALIGAVIAIIGSRVVAFIAGRFSGGRDGYGLIKATADSSTFADIMNIALTILGAISVLVLTIAGIQFISSSGNPDRVAKARNAIYYALIGLVVAILASAIINFVISKAV